MARGKAKSKEPPAELLAEYEKACKWATHFDEASPGHRTIYHDMKDRLEKALKNYEQPEPEKDDIREVIEDGTQDQ